MDPKARFDELLKLQNAILEKATAEKRAITDDESTQFDVYQKEMDNCEKMILAQKKAAENNKKLNVPDQETESRIDIPKNNQPLKLFKNFTEQLKAIQIQGIRGTVDERLLKVNNALGMSEGIGADGGFAIQQDFAGMMMETAVKDDPVLSRVDSYQVSQKADRVKWDEIDESNLSTTVFGGVRAYWAAEAATVEASAPKIMEKELALAKLMGFAYSTYELDEDSNWVEQLYTKAFQTAIRRELASAIVSGDGIGKPVGLINAGSLVSVAKETNQAADTIIWENISKMYHRALNRSEGQFVWLVHPDVHQQFDFLKMVVGTGGVPVYLPAAASGSVDTLRGIPIIESDHCSAIGDKGDIFFVDLKQYLLIYKSGINQAVSIHVQFLTAQNCFRFIFRVNGMPKKSKTMTLKNTSNARSAIVTLDAR